MTPAELCLITTPDIRITTPDIRAGRVLSGGLDPDGSRRKDDPHAV